MLFSSTVMELHSSFLSSLPSFLYIISREVLFSLLHHHFLFSIHLTSSSSSLFLFTLISAFLSCIFHYFPFSLSFYNIKEKMLDHFSQLRTDTASTLSKSCFALLQISSQALTPLTCIWIDGICPAWLVFIPYSQSFAR